MAREDCIAHLINLPDDLKRFLWAKLPPEPQPFLNRLFGNERPIERQLVPACARSEDDECEIGAAWHGLHYLLSGTAWDDVGPVSFLVAGGEVLGHGPAAAFTKEEVKRIEIAVRQIDEKVIRSRFDPARMTEEQIYPFGWQCDPNAFTWLLDELSRVKHFLTRTVEKGFGIIRYIQ